MSGQSKFSFTISDLARFLGKSAVTLRGWERHGLIHFPRNGRGDRRFGVVDIREVLKNRTVRDRVGEARIRLVEANLTLLEIVEDENRSIRSAGSR